MSFTYRLNSTGETSPPWATPASMPRHVDVADWKDVWNFGSQGMRIWLSPGKMGILGRLACKGGL
jgi:hypothetical protein